MTAKTPPLLLARQVRFAFTHGQAPIVDVPELCLQAGQHTAIVGPSGCGKTTLLRLLTGITRPTEGSIELAGHRLHTLSEARVRAVRASLVGFVFQRFALLDYCSALENILVPLRIAGSQRPNRQARARAAQLAGAAGISHVLKRKPDRLSHGEQQRVAICRALMTRPRLIACDEPTGNLDPARAESILSLILDQARESGATVLLVTHDHALLPSFEHVLDMGARSREAAVS